MAACNNSRYGDAHRCPISDNTARLRGGGLYNSGIALLTGVTFTRNTADAGGALYNAAAYQAVPSQLTMENSTFWANVADGA